MGILRIFNVADVAFMIAGVGAAIVMMLFGGIERGGKGGED